MNKNQATKKKAEWLAYCLEIGFIEKSQLDELSAIWDKYKDENGNIIAGSQWQAKQVEQPAKNEFANECCPNCGEPLVNWNCRFCTPVISKEEILDKAAAPFNCRHVGRYRQSALTAMEEYASQFAAPQAGKWVQASERLPEIDDSRTYISRWISAPNNVELLSYWQLKEYAPHGIKWLDEGSTDKNET